MTAIYYDDFNVDGSETVVKKAVLDLGTTFIELPEPLYSDTVNKICDDVNNPNTVHCKKRNDVYFVEHCDEHLSDFNDLTFEFAGD